MGVRESPGRSPRCTARWRRSGRLGSLPAARGAAAGEDLASHLQPGHRRPRLLHHVLRIEVTGGRVPAAGGEQHRQAGDEGTGRSHQGKSTLGSPRCQTFSIRRGDDPARAGPLQRYQVEVLEQKMASVIAAGKVLCLDQSEQRGLAPVISTLGLGTVWVVSSSCGPRAAPSRPAARRQPAVQPALRPRRQAKASPASRREGSHTQVSSIARISSPRPPKNRRTPMGDTGIGRKGKK